LVVFRTGRNKCFLYFSSTFPPGFLASFFPTWNHLYLVEFRVDERIALFRFRQVHSLLIRGLVQRPIGFFFCIENPPRPSCVVLLGQPRQSPRGFHSVINFAPPVPALNPTNVLSPSNPSVVPSNTSPPLLFLMFQTFFLFLHCST